MTLCYEIMCNRNKLQCPSAFTVCHIGLHPAIYPLCGSRKIPIDFLSLAQCTE